MIRKNKMIREGKRTQKSSYTVKKTKKRHYKSSLFPPLCRTVSNGSDNKWLKTTSQRHREHLFARPCSRQSERVSVLQSWHLQVWLETQTWLQNTREKGQVFLSLSLLLPCLPYLPLSSSFTQLTITRSQTEECRSSVQLCVNIWDRT